jgi:hypothetical protein
VIAIGNRISKVQTGTLKNLIAVCFDVIHAWDMGLANAALQQDCVPFFAAWLWDEFTRSN